MDIDKLDVDGTITANNFKENGEYTLQLLHFSDVDLNDNTVLNSISNFSGLIKRFKNKYPNNTLIVSTGDNYIPGPRASAAQDPDYQTFYRELTNNPNFRGSIARADMSLLNEMDVKASTIGNHELDLGVVEFKNIFARDSRTDTNGNIRWEGASFPYLAYNADFSQESELSGLVAPNGLEASEAAGKVTGWVKVTMPDGEVIGLIGASSPTFKNITSVGNISFIGYKEGPVSYDYDVLASKLQEGIDEIRGQGINKIILLSHMQFLKVEIELARRLRDVSVIIGGGSTERLKNNSFFDFENARSNEQSEGPYPIIEESLTGPVPIVNVDADYKYLGRLVVTFNKDGKVDISKLDARSNAYPSRQTDLVSELSPESELYEEPIENVVLIRNKLK